MSVKQFIIVRGPAAVGKSTIAKRVACAIGAELISFDKIMKENRLDKIEGGGISTENFLKANCIAIPTALKALKSRRLVVFDGCFYRREQIEDLVKKLPFRHHIFTLDASMEECLKRNSSRQNPLKQEDVEQVYKLTKSLDIGVRIDTANKKTKDIGTEIVRLLLK